MTNKLKRNWNSWIRRLLSGIFLFGLFTADKILGLIYPPLQDYWYIIPVAFTMGFGVKDIRNWIINKIK